MTTRNTSRRPRGQASTRPDDMPHSEPTAHLMNPPNPPSASLILLIPSRHKDFQHEPPAPRSPRNHTHPLHNYPQPTQTTPRSPSTPPPPTTCPHTLSPRNQPASRPPTIPLPTPLHSLRHQLLPQRRRHNRPPLHRTLCHPTPPSALRCPSVCNHPPSPTHTTNYYPEPLCQPQPTPSTRASNHPHPPQSSSHHQWRPQQQLLSQ